MPVYMKPTSTIIARLELEPGGQVQKFFANECYKAMDRFVPMDQGDLASTVSISVDGQYIIYEMPYAHYQYKGMREDGTHVINEANRNRSLHPQATSYWDKHMWTAYGSDIVKRVQKKIDRGGE